jgi:hypothetical protein
MCKNCPHEKFMYSGWLSSRTGFDCLRMTRLNLVFPLTFNLKMSGAVLSVRDSRVVLSTISKVGSLFVVDQTSSTTYASARIRLEGHAFAGRFGRRDRTQATTIESTSFQHQDFSFS